MAIFLRGNNSLLSRITALAKLQRLNHTFVDGGLLTQFYRDMGSEPVIEQGHIDISKWKKIDARAHGINRSMISSQSWTVLKILQSAGFEAYLVGGCVRDLLLNKTPKDFDVITTAKLKQIRKKFYHAEIVGRRFPICRVHVKGSVIEVSSFETIAKHAEEKEKHLFSVMPKGCDEKDLIRWRNCMHRDFTINSLFLDPFVNKIYDYANGMMDLRSLKLRTLIPAQLSFKEDCARILRGLRIAARLGLSFSKETETALRILSSSIQRLDKSRIMMELNYMLSYGAAEPSLFLLWRFNLLEILLPFHAAYLAQQASGQSAQSSMMLMKLFSNLDKLITCDQPSDCSLWVALLAFHLALVNNPQDALVVWTFSSVLYHGKWKEGVTFAREQAQVKVNFVPEVSGARGYKSDEELAEKVTQLASMVQASINILTETDSLFKSMSRFPVFPCSGLVFVPKKTAKDVAQIFEVLMDDIEYYRQGRGSFEINYHLLGKGDLLETRFVLGKVLLDTMSSAVVRGGREFAKEEKHGLHKFDNKQKLEVVEDEIHHTLSDMMKHKVAVKEDKKRVSSLPNPEVQQKRAKKQKLVEKNCHISEQAIAKKRHKAVENIKCWKTAEEQEVVENPKGQETVQKRQEVVKEGESKKGKKVVERCQVSQEIVMTGNVLEMKNFHVSKQKKSNNELILDILNFQEVDTKHMKVVKKGNYHISQDEISEKQAKVVEKVYLGQEEMVQQEERLQKKTCHFPQQDGVREKNEKCKQPTKKKFHRPSLSSLFK